MNKIEITNCTTKFMTFQNECFSSGKPMLIGYSQVPCYLPRENAYLQELEVSKYNNSTNKKQSAFKNNNSTSKKQSAFKNTMIRIRNLCYVRLRN